jgi:hypothetical protein
VYLPLFALLISSAATSHTWADEFGLVTISLPHLRAQPGERVIAFEVSISAGGIYTMNHLPMGWNIVIDNDPSWRTTVKGSIEVGAAAVDADYFHAFMAVRRFEYANLTFRLDGRVLVTRDFLNERWIPLTDRDFDVRPQESDASGRGFPPH